jgi:hypothetical protein
MKNVLRMEKILKQKPEKRKDLENPLNRQTHQT